MLPLAGLKVRLARRVGPEAVRHFSEGGRRKAFIGTEEASTPGRNQAGAEINVLVESFCQRVSLSWKRWASVGKASAQAAQ